MKINSNSPSFNGNIVRVHRDLRNISEAVFNAATAVAHDLTASKGDNIIDIKRGFTILVDDSVGVSSDVPMPAFVPMPNSEVLVSVRRQALTFGQKIAAFLGMSRESIAFTDDVSKAGIANITDKALRDLAKA